MPVNPKLVSVIIPAYNAAETVHLAIRSAAVQAGQGFDLEIIVVNDGSTDNTAGVLELFLPAIKVFTTPNQGASAARAYGLARANGDYIQYLDSDDILMPGKIRSQLTALESADADIAYGDWQKITEDAGRIRILETVAGRRLDNPAVEIFKGYWCPPAALLFSRRIVDKIRWNPNLPVIQDARYLFDAVFHNGKMLYVPGIHAQYRVLQPNSLSQRDPLRFVSDCFKNTSEVYELWKDEIGTSPEKREAIVASLRYCMIEFSTRDRKLFKQAVDLLLQAAPGYLPESRVHRSLSRIIGFRNAERVAAWKRKLKR
ncbi:MAG: glycosyltransferase family 2 protein [Bacteroidetes bacterium]|nr:glycosyltransferase family 2 protein [Bacteroidota bacterium]